MWYLIPPFFLLTSRSSSSSRGAAGIKATEDDKAIGGLAVGRGVRIAGARCRASRAQLGPAVSLVGEVGGHPKAKAMTSMEISKVLFSNMAACGPLPPLDFLLILS